MRRHAPGISLTGPQAPIPAVWAFVVTTLVASPVTVAQEDVEHRESVEAPDSLILNLTGTEGVATLRPIAVITPSYRLAVSRDDDNPLGGSGFELIEARAGGAIVMWGLLGLDVAGEMKGEGAVLKDAFMTIDTPGVMSGRLGWFRVPFSRARDVSVERRQMALVAVAEDLVGIDRAPGLSLTLDLSERGDLTAGIWATGDGGPDIENVSGFVGAVRLWMDMAGGGVGTEEAALDADSGSGLSAGLALMIQRRPDLVLRFGGVPGPSYDLNRFVLGPQLAAKQGRLSISLELFYSRTWVGSEEERLVRLSVPSVDGIGGYLQAGVFLAPGRLELSVRFDALDRDLEVAGWSIYPTAAATCYIFGHHLKAQLLYRVGAMLDDPFIEGTFEATPTTHNILLAIQASL